MTEEYKYTKVLCDKCNRVIRDSRLAVYALPTPTAQRKESITVGSKDICLYCCADYLEHLVATTVDVDMHILYDIAQTEAKSKTGTLDLVD